MSAWSFVTCWPDGTTVWRDPDEDATAVISIDGEVRIESRSLREGARSGVV